METTMPKANKGTAENYIFSEKRWNGTQRKRSG